MGSCTRSGGTNPSVACIVAYITASPGPSTIDVSLHFTPVRMDAAQGGEGCGSKSRIVQLRPSHQRNLPQSAVGRLHGSFEAPSHRKSISFPGRFPVPSFAPLIAPAFSGAAFPFACEQFSQPAPKLISRRPLLFALVLSHSRPARFCPGSHYSSQSTNSDTSTLRHLPFSDNTDSAATPTSTSDLKSTQHQTFHAALPFRPDTTKRTWLFPVHSRGKLVAWWATPLFFPLDSSRLRSPPIRVY